MAQDGKAFTLHTNLFAFPRADNINLRALSACFLLMVLCMKAEATQYGVANYAEAAARCQAWVNGDPKRRRCWYYARQACGVGCLRGQLWSTYRRSWRDWHFYRFPSWGCKANRPPDGILYRTATGWIDGAHPYEVCPVPPPALADKHLGSNCDPRSGHGSMIGNPCNAGTGNKSQTEHDLTVPGSDLSFVRYYNSGTNADAGLGRGWSSSLHARLEIGADTLVVRSPDGRGEPWLRSAVLWRGDPDSRFRLNEDASGYELNLPDGSVQLFDPEGRLQKKRTANGRETTYSYDPNGRLSRVTGPFGHALELVHDDNGHLSEIRDPAGNIYRYVYDDKDNLVAAIFPDATSGNVSDNPRRNYLYENRKYPNLLTGIIDEEGHRYATFEYDDAGLATSTEHAVTSNGEPQERFILNYDSASQTTVTDPVGARWVYQFEDNLGARNLVSKISLSDGKALTQTFDPHNNLVSSTDEEGRTTTYLYNEYNQRISKTEAAGTPGARTTRYVFVSPYIDLPVRVIMPSISTGQYKETLKQYDDSLNHISTTQVGYQPDGTPVSRVTTFEYNPYGQVVRIDGPRTDVPDTTLLSYHECTTGGPCGQVASIENALGQTTTYDSYNASGQVTKITGPTGLVTTLSYDHRGRLSTLERTPPHSDGRNRVHSYVYDKVGRLKSLTTPDGVVLNYTFDAAGDLRTVTDSRGNKVEYLYDLKGNRTATNTLDPEGVLVRAVQMDYDLRNHVKVLNEAGSITQFGHDAAGNLNSRIDANLNPATTHEYDSLGRLQQSIDAFNKATTYGYDVNDRLVEVQAPNKVFTSYKYDDLGNLLEEVSPDRGRISYTYDSAGNVTTIADARGVSIEYKYDALNRVISVDYPGVEEDVFFDYDALGTPNRCTNGTGKICQVRDAAGVTTYAYDSFGNIVRRAQFINGVEYVTGFTYDAGNRVVSIAHPDGRLIKYARDILGRVITTTMSMDGVFIPVLDAVNYRADGKMTSQTFGNGLAETRTYDLQGRLVTQQLGGVLTVHYAYDANGNLLSRDTNAASAAYSYDSLDRLVRDGTYGALLFNYDANGNRLTETTIEGLVAGYLYEPGTNRLTERNNVPLLHDPAGHIVDDGAGHTFIYNQSGRLSEVYRAGLRLAEYKYNAFGQRAAKIDYTGSTSQTTIYHYDLAGQLIAETGESGKQRRAYVWRDHEAIAQIMQAGAGEAVFFLHTDHLQTPRLASNEFGEIVWRWESNAFGSVFPDEDPDGDGHVTTINLRFPGQYFDAETGLHYNWHRYYDPAKGSYLSSDPIGIRGGTNTYLYALANPLRHIDFLGLEVYPIPDETLTAQKTGPFGGLCGPEGHLLAYWIPDITKGACKRHDTCYARCANQCLGLKCKLYCDANLFGENPIYGLATGIFGNFAFDNLKNQYCCR